MSSYILLSYLIVGIFLVIQIRRAEDTKTSFLANSSGFDAEWIPVLIFVLLFSPIVLPVGVFLYVVYALGNRVYTQFFKKQ